MSINNLGIKDDENLLRRFKERVSKVDFIKENTRNKINELNEGVELHLQSSILLDIWSLLLTDAIIFLKSNDEREEYHDEMTLGMEKLRAFMEGYSKFEAILYGSITSYRDHIAHVLRVYILGDRIISESFGYRSIDLVPKKLEGTLIIKDQEKEAIWGIISLSHDLGLPLQAIHRINQEVRDILYKIGVFSFEEFGSSYFTQFSSMNDFALRFISSDLEMNDEGKIYNHIQSKYYQKYLSALSRFDHGVVSSIILMKDLVYFKESDFTMDNFRTLKVEDARHFLIRREILRAIASHSCDDIYYLWITNFPFILTVCDEMQEWGRPKLKDVTKRMGPETELTINNFNEDEVNYKITFSFDTGQKPSTETEMKNVRDEIEKYFAIKYRKWCNVLRSGVSWKRKIKLRFEVEDRTNEEAITYYLLDHKTPDDVKAFKNNDPYEVIL